MYNSYCLMAYIESGKPTFCCCSVETIKYILVTEKVIHDTALEGCTKCKVQREGLDGLIWTLCNTVTFK